MPESRYETLVRQYSKEQSALNEEIDGIEAFLSEVEENRKSGKRFVDLMSRYNNFDEITPFMVNEFIDRIEVHERDRKGSIQTTQKIDIYFNFIGNYSMPEKELTEEEKAEMECMEAIKDKRHQQYLARQGDHSRNGKRLMSREEKRELHSLRRRTRTPTAFLPKNTIRSIIQE